jgi:hypothetical protein
MRVLITSIITTLALTAVHAYAGSGDLKAKGTILLTDGYTSTQFANADWGASHAIVFGATKTEPQLPNHMLASGQFQYAQDGPPYGYSAAGIIYIANGGLMNFVLSPTSTGVGTGVNWGTPVMTLVKGGVGIGTTDPAYKLDVQGQVASNGVVLTSDAKFKRNLLNITSPLDKVLNLNGLSYEWKTDEYKEKNFPDGRHFGVIAQEIEKVLPEVVITDVKGEKSVAYTEIIPVLIEAIKEQQKIIAKQQEEMKEIRSLILK